MKSIESKKLFIGLHYLLSSGAPIQSIVPALNKLTSVVYESSNLTIDDYCIDVHTVLEAFLTSLPETTSLSATSQLVDTFLTRFRTYQPEEEISEIVDVNSLFEPDPVPILLSQQLYLSDESILKTFDALQDTVRSKLGKLCWQTVPLSEDYYPNIFFNFVKCRIYAMDIALGDFKFMKIGVDNLKRSPYYSLKLERWIDGFYKPLENLSKFSVVPQLVDLETFMTPYEFLSNLMETVIQKDLYEQVLTATVSPYCCFIEHGWNHFNQWLVQYGDNLILKKDDTELMDGYKALLEIVRQDQVLRTIAKTGDVKFEFASAMLSIIYLCPLASLDVFLDSKEILVDLKSSNFISPVDDTLPNVDGVNTVSELSKLIVPNKHFIDSLERNIEAGERLNENGLSISEIYKLSESDGTKQIHELQKFIDNESVYGKSAKKYGIVLNSVYFVYNKSLIFNRVEKEQLDKTILIKLLDLRYFKTLSDNFLPNYCTLSQETLHDIMVKEAWIFFKRANNCDKNIGYLKSSLNCLRLLKSKSKETARLQNLIDATNDLLQWKFYFKAGVPITPKQILDTNDSFKIIDVILELNEKAYSDIPSLYPLLRKFRIGFNEEETDDQYLLTKLKLRTIDFAVISDFKYSCALSRELLDLGAQTKSSNVKIFKLIQDKWFSFFQLSKNGSGLSEDGEDDIETLNLKLSILSELMLIVPGEFNSNILEHWQMLNTEKTHLQLHGADSSSPPKSTAVAKSLGNLHSRLQRSIQSSANEVLHNSEGGDLGKNIIGWIVGAQ